MNILAKQSILVMGWAVVGSQVVTYAIVQMLAPEFLDTAIKVSPMVSAFVAAPLTYAFFRQTVKLEETNKQLALANQELGVETELARKEATLDPMTHMLNRTHFVRAIEENRDTDEKAGFFLMLDADNFKQVNDTYGHAAGDSVLLKITDVMRMALRDDDIVGRLGGEEFGIYLRGVNRQQAYEVAERIRSEVEQTPIEVGDNETYNATVSIGAVFAAKQHNVTQLMQMADRNLYRAKGKGRNQVVFDAFLSKEGTYTARTLSA